MQIKVKWMALSPFGLATVVSEAHTDEPHARQNGESLTDNYRLKALKELLEPPFNVFIFSF